MPLIYTPLEQTTPDYDADAEAQAQAEAAAQEEQHRQSQHARRAAVGARNDQVKQQLYAQDRPMWTDHNGVVRPQHSDAQWSQMQAAKAAKEQAKEAAKAQRELQTSTAKAQREQQRAAEEAARLQHKQEQTALEAEFRSKGITPWTGADGNLYADPLHEQKQTAKAAEAQAKADKAAADLAAKQARADAIRSGRRHAVNPVDSSPIYLESPEQAEARRLEEADKLRKSQLDEQIHAAEAEYGAATAQQQLAGQKPLTETARKKITEKDLKGAKKDALLALQSHYSTQAAQQSGTDDWIPWNESPTPEALTARQHLDRLNAPEAELTPDDLTFLAGNVATKPLADKIQNIQGILTQDQELQKFHAEHAARVADLKLRRDAPEQWAAAVKARRATLPPEQLQQELAASATDIQTRAASLQQHAATLNGQIAQHTLQLDALAQQAAQRRSQGIPAGELVTYPNEADGTVETWPRDLAAQREAIQSRLADTQAQQATDWAQIQVQHQELQRDAQVHDESLAALAASSEALAKDGPASSIQQLASTLQFSPGHEQASQTLTSLATEAHSRLETLKAAHGGQPPPEAVQALQQDIASRSQQAIQEGDTRQRVALAAFNGIREQMARDPSLNEGHLIVAAREKLATTLGISEEQAQSMIEDLQATHDWDTWRGYDGDSPKAEWKTLSNAFKDDSDPRQTRLLSNGGIVVNPSITDEKKYAAAVASAHASPEAKAAAMARYPQIRQQMGQNVLDTLQELEGTFGKDSIQDWTAFKARRPKDVSEQDWALKFSEKARADTAAAPWTSLLKQVMRSGAQGLYDLRQQASGLLAGILPNGFGSETLMQDAQWAGRKSHALELTKQLDDTVGHNFATRGVLDQLPRLAGSILPAAGGAKLVQAGVKGFAATSLGARFLPSLAASIEGAATPAQAVKAVQTLTRAGLGGAAAAGGAQTYGSQLAEIYGTLRKEDSELTHAQALHMAQQPAILSAGVTALLTTLGGSHGVEKLLTQPGAARELFKKQFTSQLQRAGFIGGEFLQGSAKEWLEEIPDELFSQYQAAVASHPTDPQAGQKALAQFLQQLPELSVAIGLMGGAGEAISGSQETTVNNPQQPSTTVNAANLPETVAAAEHAIDNLQLDGLDPATVARTQDAARGVLHIAQGHPLADLDADTLASLDLVEDPKNPGQFINGKLITTQDGSTKLVPYPHGLVPLDSEGRAAGPSAAASAPTSAHAGNTRPVRVKIVNGQPVITQTTLDNLEARLPAVRAAIPMDEKTRQQSLQSLKGGSATDDSGLQSSPDSGRETGSLPVPAPAPAPASDQTTVNAAQQPQPPSTTVNEREARSAELATLLESRGLTAPQALHAATHIVSKQGIIGNSAEEQYAQGIDDLMSKDLHWVRGSGKNYTFIPPTLGATAPESTPPRPQSDPAASATGSADILSAPAASSSSSYSNSSSEPSAARSTAAGSPQGSAANQRSDSPSAQPPSTTVNAKRSEPSATVNSPASPPSHTDAMVIAKQRAMASIPVADRPRFQKFYGALDQSLARYAPAFPGGISFTQGTAKDLNYTGAGIAVTAPESATPALEINLAHLFSQANHIDPKSLPRFVKQALLHELRHIAALKVITPQQARSLWKSLTPALRARVYASYFAADLASTSPGKPLSQKELLALAAQALQSTGGLQSPSGSETTANNGKPSPTTANLPQADPFHMAHEFLRMLDEDAEFAGQTSEAMDAHPSLGQAILEFLSSVIGEIKRLIATDLDAPTRIQVREFQTLVESARKKLLASLPPPGTAYKGAEPTKSNLSTTSDSRASVLGARHSDAAPPPAPDSVKPPSTTVNAAQQPQPPFSPVLGSSGTAYTDSNDAIEYQWAVVDANSLNISNDDSGRINPNYPQELQPRDRTSAASEAQVTDIAKNFNLDRLSASSSVGDGAPIIGPDAVVESGNGRAMGARRAHSLSSSSSYSNSSSKRSDSPSGSDIRAGREIRGSNSSPASSYRAALISRAAEFGLDPSQVSAVPNPVLVRIRRTEVNRTAFVLAANVSTIAPKRETEQAKIDSQQIVPDLFNSFVPSEDGEIFTAANAQFIRDFISAVVPPAERGQVIDASGNLSQSGLRRIRNALFVHAYGTSPESLNALGRLSESIDATDTGLARSLLAMAPRFAEQNARIANGALYPFSITDNLAQALQKLADLRARGEKVEDWLAQDRIPGIGDDPGPLTTALVQFLNQHRQRPRQILAALTRYAQSLDSAGDPRQISLFGDEKPTPLELWKLASTTPGARHSDAAPALGMPRKSPERARPSATTPSGRIPPATALKLWRKLTALKEQKAAAGQKLDPTQQQTLDRAHASLGAHFQWDYTSPLTSPFALENPPLPPTQTPPPGSAQQLTLFYPRKSPVSFLTPLANTPQSATFPTDDTAAAAAASEVATDGNSFRDPAVAARLVQGRPAGGNLPAGDRERPADGRQDRRGSDPAPLSGLAALPPLDVPAFLAGIAQIPGTEIKQGQEHTVYFDRASGLAIKLTNPGEFGARRSLENYLHQMQVINELFADHIAIEGTLLLPGESAPRLVTTQPWVHGSNSTPEEIDTYLRRRGFLRMFDGAWWHPGQELQVTDALPKNFITSPSGHVHPIDLILAFPPPRAHERIENIVNSQPQPDPTPEPPGSADILSAPAQGFVVPPLGGSGSDPLAKSSTTPDQKFYSRLAQVIAQKMPNRADAQTIRGILTNPTSSIKAEELKWSGIIPWLDLQQQSKNGPITKQAVLDYLATAGAVQFEEVTADDSTAIPADQAREYFGISPESWNELPDYQRADLIKNASEKKKVVHTKYSQYQLPGGTNYREVVLSMPPKKKQSFRVAEAGPKSLGRYYDTPEEAEAFAQKMRENGASPIITPMLVDDTSTEYRSNHFPDVPNYVAHTRLNDRRDATGQPGLFIEEIQSDRHQQAREKGYAEQLTPAEQKELALLSAGDTSKLSDEQRARGLALLEKSGLNGGIPDAPFRTTWPLHMFKRALAEAVSTDKDWIGWTTGTTQAARYDLSKQLDAISYLKTGETYTIEASKDGVVLIEKENLSPTELADHVGKELAQKIINGEGSPVNDEDAPEGARALEGIDLQVGGEGMKGFYDQILPKEISKYVKQWGAQVKRGELPPSGPLKFKSIVEFRDTLHGDSGIDDDLRRQYAEYQNQPPQSPTIWRIDITDSMRDSVAAGQSLFMASKVPLRTGSADILSAPAPTSNFNTGLNLTSLLSPQQQEQVIARPNVVTDPPERLPMAAKAPWDNLLAQAAQTSQSFARSAPSDPPSSTSVNNGQPSSSPLLQAIDRIQDWYAADSKSDALEYLPEDLQKKIEADPRWLWVESHDVSEDLPSPDNWYPAPYHDLVERYHALTAKATAAEENEDAPALTPAEDKEYSKAAQKLLDWDIDNGPKNHIIASYQDEIESRLKSTIQQIEATGRWEWNKKDQSFDATDEDATTVLYMGRKAPSASSSSSYSNSSSKRSDSASPSATTVNNRQPPATIANTAESGIIISYDSAPPDPFTGAPSLITGSTVSREQGQAIGHEHARRLRAGLREGREIARDGLALARDRSRAFSVIPGSADILSAPASEGRDALRRVRDSAAGGSPYLPRVPLISAAQFARLQRLPLIGEGDEAHVYADEKRGTVYKVLQGYGSRPTAGIWPQIYSTSTGSLDYSLGLAERPRQLAARLAVQSLLGGTPTEVVGISPRGHIILKQPLSPDPDILISNVATPGDSGSDIRAAREIRGSKNPPTMAPALRAAGLVEIPRGILYDAKAPRSFIAWVEGRPWLVLDLRPPNFVGDNQGAPRINDAVIGNLAASTIAKVPGLAAVVRTAHDRSKTLGDRSDCLFMAAKSPPGSADILSAPPLAKSSPTVNNGQPPSTAAQQPSPLARLGWNHLDRSASAKLAAIIRWVGDATHFSSIAKRSASSIAAHTVAMWTGKKDSAPVMAKLEAISHALKKELLPDSVLPREILAKKREMEIKTAMGSQRAMDLVRALSGNPKFSDIAYPKEFAENPVHRRNLYEAMVGERPLSSLPPEMQALAQRLRRILVATGQEAVKQGRMSTETFDNLRGTYMPHFYKEDVQKEQSLFHKFRLGVRDILAQRTTAWHITDNSQKDPNGEPRLVSHTGNQWRFRSPEHMNAFFEDFINSQALAELKTRYGRKYRALTAVNLMTPSKLDPEIKGRLAEIKRALHTRFQRHKPLTIAEQEKAGLIMDPVYAIARYAAQMAHDNSTAEFFNFIASGSLPTTVNNGQPPSTTVNYLSDIATPGFTEIPDNPRFGRLAGKFLQDDIASQVLEMIEAPNIALQVYDTTLGWWKAGKTVLNPGTHVRNVLGNLFFSQLAGNSVWNPGNLPYYKEALTALRNGGATLTEAYDAGVLGADFVSAELRQTLKQLLPDPATIVANPADADHTRAAKLIMGIGKTFGKYMATPAGKVFNGFQSAYQAEDEIFKLAAYLKAKAMLSQQGAGVANSRLAQESAAAHVRQWFPYFDSGSSGTLKLLGRTAMPFLGFYRESIRIFGEALKHRPLALATGLASPSIITFLSAMALGLDDDDLDEIKKDMRGKAGKLLGPTPIEGMPLFSMLLPVRSDTGQVQQFDISAIHPFVDFMGNRTEGGAKDGWWPQMFRSFVSAGPLGNLLYSNMTGKDAFFDSTIVEPNMTTGEAFQERAIHAAKTLLPPLAGTGLSTLYHSGERSVGKTLEQRSPTQAAIRVLGGLDVRNATPDLYRLADDWRKAHGYEVQEGMDYGSTTPASRARAALFKLLAQDTPNPSAIKNVLKSLDAMGHPVKTAQDLNKLLFYKDPLKLIGGNKSKGITAKDAQQQFYHSLHGEARAALDRALTAYRKIQQRAPMLLRQAQ